MAPLTYTTAEIAEMVFRHPEPDSRAAAEMVRRAGVPGRLPGRRPAVYARAVVDQWVVEGGAARVTTKRAPAKQRRSRRRSELRVTGPVRALLEDRRSRGTQDAAEPDR